MARLDAAEGGQRFQFQQWVVHAAILSDVQQHPGERGRAADESRRCRPARGAGICAPAFRRRRRPTGRRGRPPGFARTFREGGRVSAARASRTCRRAAARAWSHSAALNAPSWLLSKRASSAAGSFFHACSNSAIAASGLSTLTPPRLRNAPMAYSVSVRPASDTPCSGIRRSRNCRPARRTPRCRSECAPAAIPTARTRHRWRRETPRRRADRSGTDRCRHPARRARRWYRFERSTTSATGRCSGAPRFYSATRCRESGQRRLVGGIRRRHAAAGEFYIALRGGAHPRCGRVLDGAILGPRLERVPKRIHGGRRETGNEEPKFESIAGHVRWVLRRSRCRTARPR